MLYRLADLRLAQGDVKTAQDLATQAVAVTRPMNGAYQILTGAMEVVGDSLLAQALFTEARNQYQQALDIRQKAGERSLVAESNVSLAILAVEEGHPEKAEPLLRDAIADFEKENELPDATGAYTALSRALLAQGKLAEARTAIQHAVELGRKSSDPALTLPAAVQSARMDIAMAGSDAAGHLALANARHHLLYAITTAKKLGYLTIEFDTQLAIGELDCKTNPSLGRSELETLEKVTHERGLELLSRKAHLLAIARG
jgi:tetratricopeptide (TPR) repeat protein